VFRPRKASGAPHAEPVRYAPVMRSLTLPRGAFPLVLGVALALVTMAIGGSWSGDDAANSSAFVPAIVQIVSAGSVALLWFAMALGFGGALVDLLHLARRPPIERVALEAALGIAAALVVDAALGTSGLLLAGGGLVAWGVLVAGIVLLVRRWRTCVQTPLRLHLPLAAAALGPAVGVLLLASASEPGWLWGSEFRGYDALSYHLQLPSEWLTLGRIATLYHNVYSALPSYVESAFLHIFVLAGGRENGAIAAQCLAALVTLVAALNVACVARRLAGPVAGAVAAGLYLGTPWIIVVGSLAYNDGFVGLFLAAGLLVALKAPRCQRRVGIALGLLIAGSCGAKLTAFGFVALPLVIAVLAMRRKRAVVELLVAGVVALILLSPWLIRNALTTGNPTFPFLSALFGTGHWTPEQLATFAHAHQSELALGARFGRLWSMWCVFGFGVNPNAGEPWAPQWSLLPWVGVAGLAMLTFRYRLRGVAIVLTLMLLAQVSFWLFATHLQSRFLVPTAVILASAAASALGQRRWSSIARPAAAALVLWCLVPLVVFAKEPLIDHSQSNQDGAPAAMIGNRDIATGEAYRAKMASLTDPKERMQLAQVAPTAYWINHVLAPESLGPQPVLLIGDATPFRYRRSLRYNTVWDRGALDEVIRSAPETPELWAPTLRALGFRYVLVDLEMLGRWTAAGWVNPQLTAERIGAFLRTTKPIAQVGKRAFIGELPEAAPAQAPATGG